jgi:putative transcriptional regulator
MNVTRHPDPAWLIDYACGNLSRNFELVLAAHLMACPACTQDLRVAERLGANLMLQSPSRPTALAPAQLIAAEPVSSAWVETRALPAGGLDQVDLTSVVSQFLDCGISALPWRPAGRGLQVARLRAEDEQRLWLIKAAPGTVLPRHSHSGSELTLVLKGAFFSGDTIYSAGDIEDADEATDHQPVVTRDGECLCLAVTEGPLRFRRWTHRLAQGYLGI